MTDEVTEPDDGGPTISYDGNFAMVPLELIEAVSARALQVYAALGARWTNRATGDSYPSRKTIGEMLNCDADTVGRAMKELTECGAVEAVPRFRSDGSRTSNSYILNRSFLQVPPGKDAGGASAPVSEQEEPESLNQSNDSCRTPPAIDDETTQAYIAEFTQRLRREGVEMVALRAVDGEADAIEIVEMARLLVNARAQPMKDRPEAEKFEDTPAYRLCTFFVDAIMEADPEGKRPSITRAWVQEAGRILNPKVDGRQPGEIRAIINWIFRSNDPEGNWWQPNIRSIKKFRAQYDTLRLKMQASATAQQTRTASRGVQQQPQGAPVQFGTDGKATEAYRVWEREQRAAMKADMIAEVGEAAIEQMRADGRLPAWWDDV